MKKRFNIQYLHRPFRYYLDKIVIELILFFAAMIGFGHLLSYQPLSFKKMLPLYGLYAVIPVFLFLMLVIDIGVFVYYFRHDVSKALWVWNNEQWGTDAYLSYDELRHIEKKGNVREVVGEELYARYHKEPENVVEVIEEVFANEDEVVVEERKPDISWSFELEVPRKQEVVDLTRPVQGPKIFEEVADEWMVRFALEEHEPIEAVEVVDEEELTFVEEPAVFDPATDEIDVRPIEGPKEFYEVAHEWAIRPVEGPLTYEEAGEQWLTDRIISREKEALDATYGYLLNKYGSGGGSSEKIIIEMGDLNE